MSMVILSATMERLVTSKQSRFKLLELRDPISLQISKELLRKEMITINAEES
jgi:hypothetical protein